MQKTAPGLACHAMLGARGMACKPFAIAIGYLRGLDALSGEGEFMPLNSARSLGILPAREWEAWEAALV